MLTRKAANDTTDINCAFSSRNKLSRSQLPTKSDVIERLLYETNWHTRETVHLIAQEVIDIWMHCTVYPLSKKHVTDKIMVMVTELSKLKKYPRSKRGKTYFKNVQNFVTESQKLFDIFVHDNAKRRELETKFKLKMTEQEYWFYEDQKGPRAAKCLNSKEKLSESDLRFARRASSATATNFLTDQPSTSSDAMLSSGSDSELSSIDSTDTTLYEPPLKSVKLGQNRQSYRNLAQCCDRYNVSDRVGAALATSVLMDHGVVTDADQTLAKTGTN